MTQIHPAAEHEFKVAYSLEFLGLTDGHSEGDLHGALLHHLGRFITELGRDFCFVGSEYSVQVGNQDFASIGVLLCATKNDEVVEYALARTASPTLVAEIRRETL